MGPSKQSYIMAGFLTSTIVFVGSPSQESPIRQSQSDLAAIDSQAEACQGLCGHQPASETALGRFLENEIAERVELVSNKQWTAVARIRFARELSRAIASASYENDVDPFVLMAMVEVESRYNTKAIGTVGERGLMQIKPSTALGIVPTDAPEHGCDLHNIACNILTGARYLAHLEKQAGKRQMAFSSSVDRQTFVLRSYNLGPARAFKLAIESNQNYAESNSDGQFEVEKVNRAPAQIPTYAEKINFRAKRFQTRYLQAATSNKEAVTTIASAN